ALPDYIQVWPGHGAGSACGKSLGAVPSTTVGYERIRNWALQYGDDKAGFIDYLLSDQPEPPKYFAMMKKLNKVDRPLLTSVPTLKKLTSAELTDAMNKGIKVIDTRLKTEFGEGFIPGSINIQGTNSFSTWAGWFLNYEEPFILVAPEDQHDDLVRKLMRIGLDNIMGYIPSTETFTSNGGKLSTVQYMDMDALKAEVEHAGTQIVDLRGLTEFNAGHIKGANHIFVGTILDNLDKINKDKKIVIHCQGGDRATIGYSLLKGKGFNNVYNYTAGMNEWVAEQNEVIS
nr:rhodanese-like domain-containing protein [Saprospiraceae bacterium]